MDCRKALIDSKGDLKLAEQYLRKKGALIAAEKKNKKTNCGLIESYVHSDGRVGSLVKLNCETDFVARSKDFKKLAHELAMQAAAMKPKTVVELLKQDYIRDTNIKVADLLKEAVCKIKENIRISDFQRLEV